MTIEQNLKTLIGEYTFQIVVLQTQISDLTKQLEEAKANQVVSNNQKGGITAKEVK